MVGTGDFCVRCEENGTVLFIIMRYLLIVIVALFLWDHGNFKKFLKVIDNGEKNGYQTFLEAAFGKELKDIIPLWEEYLKDVYSKRDSIKRIPPSTILRNRLEFERFMAFYGLDFKQDY